MMPIVRYRTSYVVLLTYSFGMCGRVSQIDSPYDYARAIGWDKHAPDQLPREPVSNFNGSPGASHWTVRLLPDDRPFMEKVKWQYLSGWTAKKDMAPAINARLDKLLTPYYRGLMKTGRIIIPANGWYEWTGEKGNKQGYYIKPKTNVPLFFAGLTNHFPDKEDPPGAGFVVVTDASAGGMVDVHDRRPVSLSLADALLWLDSGTSYDQAEQIARTTTLREEYFEWFPVNRDVNNSRNKGAHLIEPIVLEK